MNAANIEEDFKYFMTMRRLLNHFDEMQKDIRVTTIVTENEEFNKFISTTQIKRKILEKGKKT